MNDRLTILSKLRKDIHFRAAYIKAKVGVLVPSQIRALRFRSDMPKQADLAKAADMWQSQISGLETPGAANMTLDMLARLAAVFRVGLIVKFVPFSEMLRWEQVFSQDQFDVVQEHIRRFSNSIWVRTILQLLEHLVSIERLPLNNNQRREYTRL